MAIKRKKIILLLILTLIFGGIFLFIKSRTGTSAPANIYTVKNQNLVLSYTFSGAVVPQKEISIFSETLAQVEKVNFRTGDSVKQGDVLLSLKASSLDDAKLKYKRLALQVEKNRRDYHAITQLFNNGGASKNEVNDAKLTLETSIIDMNIAKKEFSDFKKDIKSPISGVILALNADENYKVEPTKPLFKIADTENLQIIVNAINIKAKKLAEGQKVTVTSDSLESNKILTGKIKSISQIAQKTDGSAENTTRVVIELDNYSTLKPGDSAEVNIIYKEIKDKIVIPYNYISTDLATNKSYVLVVNKDNVLEKRYIKLGENNTINFEILEGLKVNDRIIENTNNLYKEGVKIK
ncbi:efflux RND transporter periplasmic adaptor subunit [Caviibacter abscessus]|uniref:efflux RND transporter periplasmic adaptor subunit n=1 Tax=Caviibacter abscessus TaxID=1766719 RepID=UPI0008356664|nr:efflux RND transporter periplasmic adaptor subunit [Caviibacter abscessus]